MLKKIILHIGTEKTGTTSIQEFLNLNRVALRDKGFLAPNSGGERHQSTFALIGFDGTTAFAKKRKLASLTQRKLLQFRLKRAFTKEVKEFSKYGDTAIISSEWFHSKVVRKSEMEAILKFLSPFAEQFEVVCYLREQSALANSRYSTGILHGVNLPFDEFIAGCVKETPYYNHAKTLRLWQEGVPQSSMHTRIYEKQSFAGGALISDFADVTGIKWDDTLNLPPAMNSSLSENGMAIIRALLSCIERRHINYALWTKLRDGLRGSCTLISEATYHKIHQDFAASNEQVRQTYFPERDVLFAVRENFMTQPINLEEKVEYFTDVIATELEHHAHKMTEALVDRLITLGATQTPPSNP